MCRKGFTLIEVMLVVAVVGVLSMVLVPQFANLVRKANEATTKGNLASLRGALAMYYGDRDRYPTDDLTSLVSGKFIKAVPRAYVEPWHHPNNQVSAGNSATLLASDANQHAWFYYSDPNDPRFGTLLVNCIHTDLKGTVWTTY